jgi:hypothetical protein
MTYFIPKKQTPVKQPIDFNSNVVFCWGVLQLKVKKLLSKN